MDPFHEEDEEIVSSYLVWGGIAVHYADMYHVLAKQRSLQSFLLAVVKSIFQVNFFPSVRSSRTTQLDRLLRRI